jgi:RNA polymerase sigma-70 factor (ECF subfamily)
MRRVQHPDRDLGRLAPTRQSLLSRLKNWDDGESWNEFFQTYWKLIFLTALKAGLTEAESQDVVQDTIISVSRNIPDFKYDPQEGSFKGWLLRLTYWRIRDQMAKRLPPKVVSSIENDLQMELVAEIPDPAAGAALAAVWDEEWEKNLFDAAIERVKKKVDPRSFQIFDLSVLQKWPSEKIRALLKISSTHLYVSRHRIASLLKKEMEYLETKAL